MLIKFACTLLLPLICGCFLTTNIQANEVAVIDGVVLSHDNQAPIPYALITVRTNKLLTTRADDEGVFTIRFPQHGKYEIKASINSDVTGESDWTSVSTKNVNPQNPLTLSITLFGESIEFVVIEDAPDQQISEIKLGKDELKHVAGTGGDALFVIQTLPGVITAEDDKSKPAVRGSFPGDNLYYVDFLPVGFVHHFFDGLSVIPRTFVNEINFYPSNFGPEYGDKLGAAFDIELINPNKKQWQHYFDINLLGIAASTQGPISQNQSLLLGYKRSYLDFVIDIIGDDDEFVRSPRYDDFQAKYVWNIDSNDSISIVMLGARNTRAENLYPGVFRWIEDREESFYTQAVIWDSFYGLLSSKTAVGYLKHDLHYIDGPAWKKNDDTSTFFVREKMHYQVNSKHALTLGGDLYSQKRDFYYIQHGRCSVDNSEPCTEQINVDRRINKGVLYINDKWKILSNIILSTGARLTGNDLIKQFYVEPRLSIQWYIKPRTALTAAWGRYNQMPRIEPLLGINRNTNLEHERADHFTLGMNQQLKRGWNWKTEIYYKKFWDLLEWVENDRTNINNGTGKAYGTEIFIKKDYNQRHSGWLSFTWSKSKRTNNQSNDTELTFFDSPIISTVVFTSKIRNNWAIDLKWYFHSGQPYTPITGATPVYENDGETLSYYQPIYGFNNSARYPHYHRADIRFTKKIKYPQWTLEAYLEIINIYNRDNVGEYKYSFDYTSKKAEFQFPLFPLFGFNATF